MFRLIVHSLTILHLGPGLAFLVMAFGCDGVTPALGSVCEGNSIRLFLSIMFGTWVVAGAVSWRMLRK
ncbi:MAG: hypothetical protein RLY71_4239 [Pseudomonadota bacterium]|jgi:hypothetical protein